MKLECIIWILDILCSFVFPAFPQFQKLNIKTCIHTWKPSNSSSVHTFQCLAPSLHTTTSWRPCKNQEFQFSLNESKSSLERCALKEEKSNSTKTIDFFSPILETKNRDKIRCKKEKKKRNSPIRSTSPFTKEINRFNTAQNTKMQKYWGKKARYTSVERSEFKKQREMHCKSTSITS